MFKRFIASLICVTFSFTNLQYVQAQDFSINQLPVPGTMVGESTPFAPLALKGLIINPQKPLEFQFIVDTGKGPQDTASVKDQANQLVKYFLAGLTIPEGDLWVNLSPYEKNRMVPEALGQTDLGRDLLAQDYILKQLTASLIYPEKNLGKKFWSRVYAKAQAQFGTTNIPVNTFNKVWILPDQAQVFENVNAAYVTKSTLKVMLDEDYLAKQKHQATKASSISSQIVREIVIPEITKEVNTGKNFAPLRQIYQALILAKWYKETIQNGLLDALYTNKNKVAGVDLNDPTVKAQIYERYLRAYKKGAFNYIKDDPTPDGQVVPRKYFSGGITEIEPKHVSTDGAMLAVKADGVEELVDVSLEAAKAVKMITDLPIVARNYKGEQVKLSDTGDVFEAVQKLVEQQVEVGVAIPFSRTGNLAAYFDGMNRGIFKVQVNPRRHPDNRIVIKSGKKGEDFLNPKNMPDEEAGFPVPGHDQYDIYANPSPYEMNHIVLVGRSDETAGTYPLQYLDTPEKIDVAFDFLTMVNHPDYNVTFNSEGAANSSPHFHWHGFQVELPIEHLPIVELRTDAEEIKAGFVQNYPAQVIYLEGRNKDDLVMKVLAITSRLTKGSESKPIPYNVLLKMTSDKTYKVFIFPRNFETPSQGKEGLISSKFGIFEMSGAVITYTADPKTSEGLFINSAKEQVKLTEDLIKESLQYASFQNRDFLKGIIDSAMSVPQKPAQLDPTLAKTYDGYIEQNLGLNHEAIQEMITKVANARVLTPGGDIINGRNGVSLVSFLGSPQNGVSRQFVESRPGIIKDLLADIQTSLNNAVKVSQDENLHMTIGAYFSPDKRNVAASQPLSLDDQTDAITKLQTGLAQWTGAEGIRVHFKGIVLSPSGRISMLGYPEMSTTNDVNMLNQFRQRLGLPANSNFHVSLATLFNGANLDIDKFHALINKYRNTDFGVLKIDQISLVEHENDLLEHAKVLFTAHVNQSMPSSITPKTDTAMVTVEEIDRMKKGAIANIRAAADLEAAQNVYDDWYEFIFRAQERGDQTIQAAAELAQYDVVQAAKDKGLKLSDAAMLEALKVKPLAENGGIDLNKINVLRNGKTVNVRFDPAQLRALQQGGFEGFTPVIINMTRISSPFQLLGISTPKQNPG